MIIDHCQRWTEGRASRRPAGDLIRPSEYEVASIASAAEAKAFVVRHHYAGTASSPAHRFGLYRRGALVGVALYGPPASMNAHRAVFPTLDVDQAVTLGRLVLLDEVPGNGESWFVARTFKMLSERGVIAVESCSDPQPRSNVRGDRVFRGHLGIVYRALNGRFVGRTNAATLRLLPDGSVFSNRASGKLVRGEQGRAYAVGQLERWGAAPLAGEDPIVWLHRWRARLTRPMRHRGCYRYLWSLDRRRRNEVLTRPSLPYPRADLELLA